MYLCYIDEAGCPGALPSATSNVQPILVLTGLFFPQANLMTLTKEFLDLKATFNPNVASPFSLDIARYEIKGSNLRQDIRKGNRNQRRRAFGFIDKSLDILDRHEAKLVAKVYVKAPGAPFNGRAVYTSSVQSIFSSFQNFLASRNESGLVIADSRTPGLNSIVSHSIFTQKFKAAGDSYPNIVEMPVFGHSENHAAIQITDFLSSTLLFPMASFVYCSNHVNNVHVHPRDGLIKSRYSTRIKAMSYRYPHGDKFKGGITVTDAIQMRSGSCLFA